MATCEDKLTSPVHNLRVKVGLRCLFVAGVAAKGVMNVEEKEVIDIRCMIIYVPMVVSHLFPQTTYGYQDDRMMML